MPESAAPESTARRNSGYRRHLWALRDGLRPMARPRAGKCGRCRIGPHVGIGMREGRASFAGIMACGLAWECPVCRAKIQAERAEDVRAVVEWHRENGGEAYLVTLTVRHALGNDLRALRRGVADAWRRVQAGRAWQDWRARVGFVGSVRALEVTHGGAGWHPHIHVLLLANDAPAADVESWRAALSARWQVAVTRTLGAEHCPTDRRGCDVRVSHSADYIAKLGLEIANATSKAGRNGNRSPLEIAEDWVNTDDVDSGVLWRAYAKGMSGARMLTWSKGLRAAAGLGEERTDEEIVADDEKPVTFLPKLIPAAGWDALARVRGAALRVLEVAEKSGVDAAEMLYRRILSGRAPPWVDYS